MRKNVLVREIAAKRGVKLWQIAYALGISDATFSRKIRQEFSAEEREKILGLIEKIAEAEGGAR